MSEKTILVIDDSSTIRRLVDSELSNAGYRVVLAPTAEEGIAMATDENPDLILLDHQLPGITGYDVCCQLVADPKLKNIPVVCSSTLRKKAYAEYTELDNVIDMLPKPYTPELLRTIVANALETAAMIVNSQSGGTAVPEVIDEMAEGDLSGSFASFSLREVVDFLNNGNKRGAVEIDLGRSRVAIHLADGRIQAVTASGIDIDLIAKSLPAAICDLAPMVKFTMRGKKCSEVDGLVELLDNKVLDARLLRQLLRHQASVLLNHCHAQSPQSFRFDGRSTLPSLYSKLPLDLSLLALLVDASLLESTSDISETEMQKVAYVRNPQRGQNLDRSGLGAGHMQLLNLVATPTTIGEIAERTNLQPQEIHSVLDGFVRAELVSKQEKREVKTVLAVSGEVDNARRLNDFFRVSDETVSGKVVRDTLAVKLMLRRVRPDVLLVDLDCDKARQTLAQLCIDCPAELETACWIGITNHAGEIDTEGSNRLDMSVQWPEMDHELNELIQRVMPEKTADFV